MNNVGKEVAELLLEAVKELGGTVTGRLDELGAEAQASMLRLSKVVGKKGWMSAVQAEAHIVLMTAAIKGIDSADAFDAKVEGFVQGLLTIGAKALAAAV